MSETPQHSTATVSTARPHTIDPLPPVAYNLKQRDHCQRTAIESPKTLNKKYDPNQDVQGYSKSPRPYTIYANTSPDEAANKSTNPPEGDPFAHHFGRLFPTHLLAVEPQ